MPGPSRFCERSGLEVHPAAAVVWSDRGLRPAVPLLSGVVATLAAGTLAAAAFPADGGKAAVPFVLVAIAVPAAAAAAWCCLRRNRTSTA